MERINMTKMFLREGLNSRPLRREIINYNKLYDEFKMDEKMKEKKMEKFVKKMKNSKKRFNNKLNHLRKRGVI